MADFKRILVPTDFTETSEQAIEWALSLAERLGSWVTLMHAYEIPIIGFPDGALVATADIATRIADASRARLESAVAKRQGRKVKVDGILRDGVAWEEINHVADGDRRRPHRDRHPRPPRPRSRAAGQRRRERRPHRAAPGPHDPRPPGESRRATP